MACCPFHEDRTPSMKVDRRYHCFGCQADGDVIDFVSRLEGISPKEAALRLAADFSIPYEEREPPDRSRSRPKIPKESPEQQFRRMERHCFRVLSDYYHLLRRWERDYAPKTPEYGRQKGWEREIPATDSGNGAGKTPEGFVEVTEQMELPF